ncbi:MAG: glycosyltransferase [Leptolyngbya sp. IPPAS B-1204]
MHPLRGGRRHSGASRLGGRKSRLFHWVANMNDSMGKHGGKLLQEDGPFHLIHAHDWLVADAAIALKHLFKIPLIATIHATEFGRHNGLHTETHRYINSKEAALVTEAWRVIVCTQYMRQEMGWAFHCPADKVDVIYNGICQEKKQPRREFDFWRFRRRFAADQEKIVYYVGRLTYERGLIFC